MVFRTEMDDIEDHAGDHESSEDEVGAGSNLSLRSNFSLLRARAISAVFPSVFRKIDLK